MTENEWGLVREPYSHITVGGITKYLRENYGIDLTESPHALAAMSLYLQPFGFTHEEANVLRDIPQRIKAKDILIHERSVLDGVADKIDALLPPTDSTER
jgi:hypothetical protein